MSIEVIQGKKIGYLRVSQSIPLTEEGSMTIGGFTQRMAILDLLDRASCDVTFLSEVRKDDVEYLHSRGWHYDPFDFNLGDKYEYLLIENAATHNLFFSTSYNKNLPEGFTEHDQLPLVQIQDRRIATFTGKHIFWQCLDPLLIRLMWMPVEEQVRLGKMTTVWSGALNIEPYKERLSGRNELYNNVKKENWKFFSAKRFKEYLPINPLSSRNLTLTYLGSKKPRLKILKDIYLNDNNHEHDIHLIGRGWSNSLAEESPKNVNWWEPVHQKDALHIMNQSIATVVIGDPVFLTSDWFTTRSEEGIYGNCVMMVSDKFNNPEKFVFDERLIVNGKTVGKALDWILSQDYVELIMKQREFFKKQWYTRLEDEYAMFDYSE